MGPKQPVKLETASNRPRWIAVFAVLLTVCVGASYFLLRHGGSETSSEEPSEGGVARNSDAKKDIDGPEQGQSSEDTWETEVFASSASKQLKTLAGLLKHPPQADTAGLRKIADESVSVDVLRPEGLVEVFSDGWFSVLRSEMRPKAKEREGSVQTGLVGMGRSLDVLSKPLFGASDIHVKFKIYSVDAGPSSVRTDVLYQASGTAAGRAVQQNAVWQCRWSPASSGGLPKLQRIELTSYEEVVGRADSGALFADCTESVFRDEVSFGDQILRGIDYWRGSLQAQYGVYPYGHHGIAVGDVDGDGLEDLYVCQPSGLPNRLYLQNDDGTVRDAAGVGGVDWLDRSRGALLVDLDNDGDQDLAVVLNDTVVLMANDGGGVFSARALERSMAEPGGLAAADYDSDGDLDVYVVNYGARFLSKSDSAIPTPYYDAVNGGANMLLRNDGAWVFSDVTATSGLDENNSRWSFAASWEDYDNDGDVDLYVANDFGRNNLYRNDDGRFVDVSAEAGVEDVAAGMSASWGDSNQDGKMDLYVGNMFSSAGLRVAPQSRFQSESGEDVRRMYRRHARGNSLFLNGGDGAFRDVSESAGVTMGRWSWASKFADINNDGLEDLLVANGFVTGRDTNDL
ncbi:MAG: hypothetical protein CMJ48_03215 [Planctomycetaceae bacterium]|nr:hypothetical protein [Planctomycetaceae bacterium]